MKYQLHHFLFPHGIKSYRVHIRPHWIYQNSAWQQRLKDTNKGNWMAMFIQFLCLCPLGLAINLNFNISKVAYCYKGSSMKTVQLRTVKTALSCYPSAFLLNISLTFCVLWLMKHCLHVTCRCALILFLSCLFTAHVIHVSTLSHVVHQALAVRNI